jgi:hypothetical protein
MGMQCAFSLFQFPGPPRVGRHSEPTWAVWRTGGESICPIQARRFVSTKETPPLLGSVHYITCMHESTATLISNEYYMYIVWRRWKSPPCMWMQFSFQMNMTMHRLGRITMYIGVYWNFNSKWMWRQVRKHLNWSFHSKWWRRRGNMTSSVRQVKFSFQMNATVGGLLWI